jgi:iron-sulfur cluster assembly protein
MIKVSDQAKSKAAQLMTEEGFNPETDYIRVGVKRMFWFGIRSEV